MLPGLETVHRSLLAPAVCAVLLGAGSAGRAQDVEAAPAAPAPRTPVPAAAAQAEAARLVREVFAELFAQASSREDQLSLSGELTRQALETRYDAAGRFVLLQEARRLASAAGDVSTTAAVARLIARDFDVDGPALVFESLRDAAGSAATGEQRAAAAELGLVIVDRAVEDERFEQAVEVQSWLASVIDWTGSDLAPVRDEVLARLQARKRSHEAAQASLAAVAAGNDDPKANLAAGRYRCFVQGRLAEGLPLLARGEDRTLAEVAKADLAKPADAWSRYGIALAWSRLAATAPAAEVELIRRRAAHWYGGCHLEMPGLHGTVARLRAEATVARPMQVARQRAEALAAAGRRTLARHLLERVADLDPVAAAAALAALPPADGADFFAVRVPEKYAGRAGAAAARKERGVSRAIERGLAWLAAHQDLDGRWDADAFMKHDSGSVRCDGAGKDYHDIGLTGLAVLALSADGNTTVTGPHRAVLARAVRWLASRQDSRNGLLHRDVYASNIIYDHSIATTARVEAFGLSGDEELRKVAQAAVDYLGKHRTRASGWGYDAGTDNVDTSVTGWAALACCTARDFDLNVDPTVFEGALAWIDRMTDPDSGRTGYTDRGGYSARLAGDHSRRFPREYGECMTAVALTCRYFLGRRPAGDPVMERQAEVILRRLPTWDTERGSVDLCYWYFAATALRQEGGDAWTTWSTALRAALLPAQRQDGAFAGSWDPVGVWGEEGGRVYSTAIALLGIQADHRYARLCQVSPVPPSLAFWAVRRAWEARRFDRIGPALEHIDPAALKAGERPAVQAIRDALDQAIADARGEVDVLGRGPDYLSSKQRLEEIEVQFQGLEPASAAAAELTRFKRDRAIQREIRAGEQLDALLARFDPADAAQRRGLVGELERFARRFKDSFAGRRATELATELEAGRR